MGKKVVVISTSLRAGSNSAALADEFAKGAKEAGNEVEFISLKDKKAEDEESVPDKAVTGLQGWVDCYGKVSIKGMVFCGGVNTPGDIAGKDKLHKAYEMGRNI